MTEQEMIPAGRSGASSRATDLTELHLLLPVHQFVSLEGAAVRAGLSVSALVQRAVSDFLPSPAADPVLRPYGVLVIDDTEVVRSVLEIGLGASGFTVWLAAGGREGVTLYLTHRAAIDVVLLDVNMPVWDGPATLAALRALNPDVPCCFMSGDMRPYIEENLLNLGAKAVFQKPFRLDKLIEYLRGITASSL